MSFVHSDIAWVIEKLYGQQYEFKSYIIHNILARARVCVYMHVYGCTCACVCIKYLQQTYLTIRSYNMASLNNK